MSTTITGHVTITLKCTICNQHFVVNDRFTHIKCWFQYCWWTTPVNFVAADRFSRCAEDAWKSLSADTSPWTPGATLGATFLHFAEKEGNHKSCHQKCSLYRFVSNFPTPWKKKTTKCEICRRSTVQSIAKLCMGGSHIINSNPLDTRPSDSCMRYVPDFKAVHLQSFNWINSYIFQLIQLILNGDFTYFSRLNCGMIGWDFTFWTGVKHQLPSRRLQAQRFHRFLCHRGSPRLRHHRRKAASNLWNTGGARVRCGNTPLQVRRMPWLPTFTTSLLMEQTHTRPRALSCHIGFPLGCATRPVLNSKNTAICSHLSGGKWPQMHQAWRAETAEVRLFGYLWIKFCYSSGFDSGQVTWRGWKWMHIFVT